MQLLLLLLSFALQVNDYDSSDNLIGSTRDETEKLFRLPDAVGNLYRRADRKDRKYGAGGRLLETENTKYHYDEAGNLGAKVVDNSKIWRYKWNANGSLREVERPDRRTVAFEYDALGRRTAKIFNGKITRWLWDGNTPLHEWTYDEKDCPKTVTDEFGLTHTEGTEPTENVTTWVFEEGSFRPAAKITEDKQYSILTDYLGTPVQMYDEKGEKTWEMELDIYGKVHTFAGRSLSDCPFRWQGQYEDAETGLYYNRHRYYDPDTGNYISQDPIGLEGGAALYAYVHDPNSWIDPFGLKNWNYHNMPEIDGFQKHHIIPKSLSEGARPHEIFKLSGYDVHNTKNVIYLPTDRRYHKTRSIHDGFNKFHSQYNADIRSQLTDLVEVGKANNWTKQQYHDALQNVINDTRQDLRKGKTKLHCKG